MGWSGEKAPNEAIAALRAHEGAILVDLDETLYLRNSTEDFLDSAIPAPLALLVLRFLDALKPWRFTGGPDTRDVWRVTAIALLFPWTFRRWNRTARQWGDRFRNEILCNTLNGRGKPFVVVTRGFDKIAKPLIDAMGVGAPKIIACRFGSLRDRRLSKRDMAIRVLGDETVAKAALVTDSLDDRSLLQAVNRPLLTRWPGATWVPALGETYFPGQYLDTIKQPGTGALKGVIVDDFPLWVLATAPFSLGSFSHIVGLALLFVSFWAVYELGYMENDAVAARFEREPVLSSSFRLEALPKRVVAARYYAVAFGFAGCLALFHNSLNGFASAALIWFSVLATTRAYYHLYNRTPKRVRAWLYAGLQGLRYGAFAVMIPVNVIGVLACAARALSRWQAYFAYRTRRRAAGYVWVAMPVRTLTLGAFTVLVLVCLLAGAIARPSLPMLAAVFAWLGYLTVRELQARANGSAAIATSSFEQNQIT